MKGSSWITVTVLLIAAELAVGAPKETIEQGPMVIVSDDKSHFIDAVGKPVPRPMVPAPLASPVNLLNPDKYEFYTFDVKGDLIKRLMTMEEIQSIVANGDSEGTMFLPNTQNKESEADIQGILENIQDVLSKEIERNNNESNSYFLDTPDVSSNWNMILPAIFGNTGDPIVPHSKPPSYAMTPESDIIHETTTKSSYKTTVPTKVHTTPKPTTTTSIPKTTPGRISSVVYPSKTRKPVVSSTLGHRPASQSVELKNTEPITTSTTKILATEVKTTAKPVQPTPSESLPELIELKNNVPLHSQFTSSTAKPISSSTVFKTTRAPIEPEPELIELKNNAPLQFDPAFTTSTTKPVVAKSTKRPYKTTPAEPQFELELDELKNNAPMQFDPAFTTSTTRPHSSSTAFKYTRKPYKPTPAESVKIISTATQFRPTSSVSFSTKFTVQPSTLLVTETSSPPTTSTTTTTQRPTTTTQRPTTTTQRTTTTTQRPTTTTQRTTPSTTTPTTTTTTTTTEAPVMTTTAQPINESETEEEEAVVEDPLSQIIQTLNESPSAPMPTNRPMEMDKVQPTTDDVETATKIYRPLEIMIPVDIHAENILVKIAQNLGIGNDQVKSGIKPNIETNVENKPNKVFTNSEFYVDEEEPEVHENPTTMPPATTVLPKRTTPYPIYNRPNGIAQKVDEYIASQEVVTTSDVIVDQTALPFMGEKMNDFMASYAEMQKDNSITTTTLQPESEEEEEVAAASTDGYSMLEESLSGILNQVSDSRPHSVPLVEDHRIESKIKEVENPEEFTIDEELDKLEEPNEDDDEEEEELMLTTTTEKIDVVSKNDLPPLEESTENPQDDKFEALESLSLIVDALNDDAGDKNELKEEAPIVATTEALPTTTPQNVTFITSIVKETHSVSVHQAKPPTKIIEDVKNTLDTEDKIESSTAQLKDNENIEEESEPLEPEVTSTPANEEEEKAVLTTTIIPDASTEDDIATTTQYDEEEEEPEIETTTIQFSSSSEELPESLQVENLTLDTEIQVAATTEIVTEQQPTMTEEPIETTTQLILDTKIVPEVLRKSDLEDTKDMQQDEVITTTEGITESSKDEEDYEKLGETTTVEPEIKTTTIEEEITTEAETTTVPPSTTTTPEPTTVSEEIITKSETKFTPTKVRFQTSTSGYRPSGFKRPGSVFHVKNKPAIRIEQRNPTRNPAPVRLQSAPKDALGLEQSTVNMDPDYMDFTRLCNDLAFSYWTTLQTDGVSNGRSVILSPFGITSMLSMVFLGARGATSGEMNEILKLDDMITFNPHLVFRNVTDSIENLRENGVYTSALVRELFSDRSKGKLLPFYKEKSQQYYAGYVEEANFNVINDIVRRRTNLLIKRHTWGKIMEYLRTNTLVLQGPLAAVTATVFQTDCSKASVADRDGEMFFQMEPVAKQRKLVPVPSVVIKSGFTAGYDPELDATMVGLGNGNNIVSTLFLMPGQQGTNAPGDNLERLEEAFMKKPMDNWHRLLTTLMERQDIELQIPKFTHRSFINGTTLMQRMGLKELFDSSKSDLRGLTANANQDMYLADLLQINTFSTCGEDKIPDSHYKEVYPSPPSQKQLSYARFRKLSKKIHNPYLSTLPENILSRMHLTADQVSEANEETVKYVEYQRALFDPFYDTKYMELPLPLRPRQARIPDSPRLKFDKPFLYFVRHNPTGMLLYMGRFNPKLN